MDEADRDMLMRMAAFEHVRRLGEVHDHLTATELKPGFVFEGERIPLVNPQRGIFKPQQMRFLLSITAGPRPSASASPPNSATRAACPRAATPRARVNSCKSTRSSSTFGPTSRSSTSL